MKHQFSDHIIDARFQKVNRLFVLSFEDNAVITGYKRYFLSKVEKKDHNVMIDGKNVLTSKE